MTKRREVLQLLAGAAGLTAGVTATAAGPKTSSEPELRRVSYKSARMGVERDYFVYLPRGHAEGRNWPVLLFLHGNGERGDGKAELDYVLAHGPLYEAWCQKRDLPFVIISPQLPMFSMGDVDYIKNRTPAQIPRRQKDGVPARPDEKIASLDEPMQGRPESRQLPGGPQGPKEGWFEIENELLEMVDRTVASFKGDARRVYLSGLSYGGFGAWYLAARHPEKFAAMVPVVGYGHPEHAAPIAKAKLPVWVFAGGRDPTVELKYFYPALNELEKAGHPSVRFTIEEDLGHFAWVRVYEGEDVYRWMLSKSKT
jgi:predicted peptidase